MQSPDDDPAIQADTASPDDGLEFGNLPLPPIRLPRRAPNAWAETFGTGSEPANWIAAAFWTNKTGHPITRFSTTWKVPREPTTKGEQLIYLFSGLEQHDATILQPVLQWGRVDEYDAPDKTGPFWTVASFLFPPVGPPQRSKNHVQVSPGKVLTGLITRIAGGHYRCEFVGIEDTKLEVSIESDFVYCAQALEAYRTQDRRTSGLDLLTRQHYPPDQDFVFDHIDLTLQGATPSGGWKPKVYFRRFGQAVDLTRDTTSNGCITLSLDRSALVASATGTQDA